MSNLPKVQEFFAAYANKDVPAMRNIIAEDIVWHVPGHHPLSGDKHGIEEVLAYFEQLSKAEFQAQILAMAEEGDYVFDHHRRWSNIGCKLDMKWCLIFRFENGKIQEAINFCGDQHKADVFFNDIYELKPVPERLL